MLVCPLVDDIEPVFKNAVYCIHGSAYEHQTTIQLRSSQMIALYLRTSWLGTTVFHGKLFKILRAGFYGPLNDTKYAVLVTDNRN